ncbi:TPA: hypothetical protein DEG21_04410 [Patescibacteria group bacterium]|nr:hypothetical protein [Candidatus Gracilibacteria bacterium]HBY75079.1 hypothetical protein [Candidatus Gracilibacteria bacterium]
MLPKIDERLGEVKIDKSKQPYEVIENPIYMEVTTPKPEETKTEEKTPAPVFKEVPFNLKTQLESNKKVVVAEYTTTS